MIARVIPLKKLPRNLHAFDYLVPKEYQKIIKKGQLVEIPWKKTSVQGIIFDLVEESEFDKLKPITQILEKQQILLPYQLKLALWMAKSYFVSATQTAKLMHISFPKRIHLIVKQNLELSDVPVDKLTQHDQQVINELKNKNILYQYQDVLQKNKTLIHVIKNHLENNQQVLILVPRLIEIDKLVEQLPQDLQKFGISILNNKVYKTKNRYFQEWSKIRFNKSKIIIGTRSALFASFANLGLIVIDNEAELDYKQYDQNPRYHAIEVAYAISKLIDCKLFLTSLAPSVDSHYHAKSNDYKLIHQPKQIVPKVNIIDLNNEQKKQSYSLLTPLLLKQIRLTLLADKQIVIFLNRRGYATSVVCNDCNYVFNCEECNIPLILHNNDILKCHHCGYEQKLATCKKCSGINYFYTGTGIQKIEQTIKKIFNNKKIIRIDSDSVFTEEQINNADIVIGTSMILSAMKWENLGLAAFISADSLLYLPDFKALEKTFQILVKIVSKMDENAFRSTLFIQTKNPQNQAILAVKNHDYDMFYDYELNNRDLFNYPPYQRLIKLIYQNINYEECQKEANKLVEILRQNKKNNNIKIYDPINAYLMKVRGKYRLHVIIKYRKKNLTEVNKLVNYVPTSWIIDKNPDSLL